MLPNYNLLGILLQLTSAAWMTSFQAVELGTGSVSDPCISGCYSWRKRCLQPTISRMVVGHRTVFTGSSSNAS